MKEIPLFKVFMPPEADAEVIKTLHSGYLAEGAKVAELRQAMRSYLGTEMVVPMSSCTMALTIGYLLAGVGPGDEVISTPLTSIATNTPIVQLGARIVWADCEPTTGMIDPSKLEEIITPKTKAIVVLHKDGDLAKMDEIKAIAKAYNIKIVEDAAHALGAKYKGTAVGTISDYACFSLQAIKHITTADGGIFTCVTEEDFLRAKKLKWLGADKETTPAGKTPWEGDITEAGYKGNMNDLTATVGLASMPHLQNIVDQYHRNGELYTKLLQGIPGVECLERDPNNYAVYWVYTLMADNRDKILAALKAEGIGASVVHPRNDVYSVFAESRRPLPGVDHFSSREFSLPCGWWVTEEDIHTIVDIIRKNI
jgi:perosamine synthetase